MIEKLCDFASGSDTQKRTVEADYFDWAIGQLKTKVFNFHWGQPRSVRIKPPRKSNAARPSTPLHALSLGHVFLPIVPKNNSHRVLVLSRNSCAQCPVNYTIK